MPAPSSTGLRRLMLGSLLLPGLLPCSMSTPILWSCACAMPPARAVAASRARVTRRRVNWLCMGACSGGAWAGGYAAWYPAAHRATAGFARSGGTFYNGLMNAVMPPAAASAAPMPTTLLASETERAAYRDYDQPGIDRVRTFYRNNHQHQTLD